MPTKKAIKLLKMIEQGKEVPNNLHDELNGLLRAGLVSNCYDSDGEWIDRYEITFEGKVALEVDKKLSKSRRNEWIRYIITTAIALAAFLKSFFFSP